MVALSNGDVTSGLNAPLAAEVYDTPLLTTKKIRITYEVYDRHEHMLNVNREL